MAARRLVTSLLELVYPEECALCGTFQGSEPWVPPGAGTEGLRFWDGTHLCACCQEGFEATPLVGRVGAEDGSSVRVAAGARTHPDLVKLVGCFKYHGMRGLAWPLAELLRRPFASVLASPGGIAGLVPVPLHSRRRRVRGFNQSEILARVLTAGSGVPVLTKVLVRRRNTDQQAKIPSLGERRRNLEDSFAVREPPRAPDGPARVALVDDLVTSGWTVLAAAAALRTAGWRVPWVLTLGLAGGIKNAGRRVDTRQGGF